VPPRYRSGHPRGQLTTHLHAEVAQRRHPTISLAKAKGPAYRGPEGFGVPWGARWLAGQGRVLEGIHRTLRLPPAEGLGDLLSSCSRLVRGGVPGVGGAPARPAVLVRRVQSSLVQATRRLAFRRHAAPNPWLITAQDKPGSGQKDHHPPRASYVLGRPGSRASRRPSCNARRTSFRRSLAADLDRAFSDRSRGGRPA
jgi:hypothetical protein